MHQNNVLTLHYYIIRWSAAFNPFWQNSFYLCGCLWITRKQLWICEMSCNNSNLWWQVWLRLGSDLFRYHWGCPVVSGTRVLAVDPLNPIGCEVGPPWIVPVRPTITWLDWELGNLGWALYVISLRQFLSIFCGVAGRIVLQGGPVPSGIAIAKGDVIRLQVRV